MLQNKKKINRKFPSIPSVTYRWSSSKTVKSSCCSNETLFPEGTCGFRRRDEVNYVLNTGVRKHLSLSPYDCKPFGSYSHSYFCSCIKILWIKFQLCPFITIILTTFCPCIAMTNKIDALTKHHPTAFITICHHQRQGSNCTLSCGATVVPAQDTWFVHRSDCPALTFLETRIFPELAQPNVGLFPIRAGGPSRLLRLRQI